MTTRIAAAPLRVLLLHCVLSAGLTITALGQSAAPSYLFTHFAGSLGGPGIADGSVSSARFDFPDGVALDSTGNLYVVDSGNNTIRKVSPTGVVSTFAGTPGVKGSADGTGAAARFNDPHGLAVDGTGTIYVADSGNFTIRKITPAGVVTTLAGTAGGQGSADGLGAAGWFWYPRALALDSAGNVYVADNSTIRKVTPAGLVSTLAGKAGPWGSADGTGPAAQFSAPSGIAVDSTGIVYVADSGNNAIRKITPDGVVTTLRAATGLVARFSNPHGVVVDSTGNLFVTEWYGNVISQLTPGGVQAILAGTNQFPTGGIADGTGAAARFFFPGGIARDSAGNLFVADYYSHTIRKIAPGGVVTTLAGLANVPGSRDATGADARFYLPGSIALDGAGNLYVYDSIIETIRKVTPAGTVTTVWGLSDFSGSIVWPGTVGQLFFNGGMTVDRAGNVFLIDIHKILKIAPDGVVTTFAGKSGFGGSADGTGPAAQFNFPRGAAADSTGNLYVADSSNNTIRKVTPDGVVTTLAGKPGVEIVADGTGAAASFYYPSAVAVDGTGNIYVVDDCTIRKITLGGVVTTLAGTPGVSESVDGTGAAARFVFDSGTSGNLTVDSAGVLYYVDRYNCTIRRITPAGVVTTIGGRLGVIGCVDGIGPAASFNYPASIAVDGSGNLYISDTGNNAIRKGQVAGPPVITTQPQGQSVTAGDSVQFSVNASSLVPLTYQWYVNGTPFTGATASTLSFTNARSTDAGDYTVSVANELGSVTSNKATLAVSTPAPTPTPTPPPDTGPGGGGGGGGGSMNYWFVLALLALGLARSRRRGV